MKSLTFLARVALPLALLAGSGIAAAQNYPTKALRMVVPFAPSGPNDILARLISQKLTEAWGQAVLVENRGGAGGTVGLEAASRLPGDGYALAMGGASNLAVAPSLYAKLPYDPIKDFTPIINVAIVPYALAVNPTVPAKNVKELIVIAGKKPGNLSYGSSGMGSISSLAAEMLKAMSKTDIVHVPYKGTAPALTDVVSGQIDLMLADLAVIQPHASTGRLRVIGVTGSKRSVAAKDIPTIAESGLPGYELSPWFGVVAPAGVPKDIVTKLNATIGSSLKTADMLQRLGVLGYEPLGGSAEHFAATIKSDIEKYAKIVKSAGIKADL
jgi:tripartite-type tricarboxylate transporter receptor subunit TctC